MDTTASLVEQLAQDWEHLAPHIVTDPGSYWFGSTNIVRGNITDLLAKTIVLYYNEHSPYYRDSAMLERILAACRHLLKRQHESGCLSLMDCNLDSPPDTAFAVHTLGMAYRIMDRHAFAEASEAKQLLYRFLERTRNCLATGGIHTPNHRWVMCGALAVLYELFPEERLRRRVFAYLDEGFDLTEYGEWTERSNAVYNAHCCLNLFHVYRVFGHTPSLEAAARNLNMMLYMLHPDGSIVTEYSSRQDRGQQIWMSSHYEIVFRLLSSEMNNPDFASMADFASRSVRAPSPELITYWMIFPDQMKLMKARVPAPPNRYTKWFDSGYRVMVPKSVGNRRGFGPVHGAAVLRHRHEALSVTVMAGQPEWLFVQYGEARMTGLRLVAGYFGLGGISFPTIVKLDDFTYRLEVDLEWGYMGPLDRETAQLSNGSFVNMPHELREQTHPCRLSVTIDIGLEEQAVNLTVTMNLEYPLIAQLVAVFDDTGSLAGDGTQEVRSNLFQLRTGEGIYRKGKDWLRLSPGAHEHEYTVVRGDVMNYEQKNMTINWMGPVSTRIRLQGGSHP